MPITCLPAGLEGVPKWTSLNREEMFPYGRGRGAGPGPVAFPSEQVWIGPRGEGGGIIFYFFYFKKETGNETCGRRGGQGLASGSL